MRPWAPKKRLTRGCTVNPLCICMMEESKRPGSIGCQKRITCECRVAKGADVHCLSQLVCGGWGYAKQLNTGLSRNGGRCFRPRQEKHQMVRAHSHQSLYWVNLDKPLLLSRGYSDNPSYQRNESCSMHRRPSWCQLRNNSALPGASSSLQVLVVHVGMDRII